MNTRSFVKKLAILMMLMPVAASCAPFLAKRALAERIKYFGHRNWIAIVDAAYPLQSARGIDTIYVGGDQLAVVESVMNSIRSEVHLRPVVHMDRELDFVAESDAPGVGEYKKNLVKIVGGATLQKNDHADLIDRLAKDSEKFQIFIIKTDLTIPYSSVFIEIDCGYWNGDAEQRLRSAIQSAGKQ